MRRPGIWWIGLAPAVALWLALIHVETAPFERDLAVRAAAAMRERLGDAATVEARGRDIRLGGLIFDESARGGARHAVEALAGVRQVADAMAPPPPLSPYDWRAVWDGSLVSLSGGVPSPADRARLVAAAHQAFPYARIRDDMAYASGAPKDFALAAARALAVLAHLQSGEAQWRGGEVSLAGQAANDADYRAALALAEADGRAIRMDLVPPLANSFSFVAESNGESLRLSGLAGSEADRGIVLAEARRLFPGAKLMDGLQTASGAPPKFAAESVFALRALAQLKRGKVSLGDHEARLSGAARPGMDAAGVVAALPREPGVKLDAGGVAGGDITPYVLGAEKGEKALTLTGLCGDAETCARIREAARQKFAGLALNDSMRAAPGAPDGFVIAALAGLDQLARLRLGRFDLRDAAAELRGDAVRTTDAEAVKNALVASLPAGFAVQAYIAGAQLEEPASAAAPQPGPVEPRAKSPAKFSVTPPEASGACKLRLVELARASTIQFDYGGAELPPESAAPLNALAAEAIKCPQAVLEISGHSDDIGSISRNFEFSWRRAEMVAAFLLAAGVPAERLKVEGYGETLPVAPNDSDRNRAKNRRIEIQVK